MKVTSITVTETEIDLMAIPIKDWPKEARDYMYRMPTRKIKEVAQLPLAKRKQYVVDFVERKQKANIINVKDL